ncbi:hypothetical protein DET49_11734 [Salegentibacter sp. 24]|nr:hypothetical protein DET49_11734 [Salegentibacter sp. 24]
MAHAAYLEDEGQMKNGYVKISGLRIYLSAVLFIQNI